jgi:hypothetical protein
MSDRGHLSVDLALELLRRADAEIHWDDAWETLKSIDDSSKRLAPLFRSALRYETSFARLYALAALKKIGVRLMSMPDEVRNLLRDDSPDVRREVLSEIARERVSDRSVAHDIGCLARRSDEYLGNRLIAVALLLRTPNGLAVLLKGGKGVNSVKRKL